MAILRSRKIALALLVLVAIVVLAWQDGLLQTVREKLAVFESKQGSAALSWSVSEDKSVTGYKVYYGTSPRTDKCPAGGYEKSVDVGKKPQYVLNKLETGKTYYFSVTSYNSAKKESCFSEEMQKTINESLWTRIKTLF